MSNIKVRLATMDDMRWIVSTAAVRMLVEEFHKPHFYNPTHLIALCEAIVPKNTVWIAVDEDVPIGILASTANPNIYNPDRTTLTELFWWVDPEYRHSRAAFLLLKEFKKKALEYDEATFSLLDQSKALLPHFQKDGWKIEIGLIKET